MQILYNYNIFNSPDGAEKSQGYNDKLPGNTFTGLQCKPRSISISSCPINISTQDGALEFTNNTISQACGGPAAQDPPKVKKSSDKKPPYVPPTTASNQDKGPGAATTASNQDKGPGAATQSATNMAVKALQGDEKVTKEDTDKAVQKIATDLEEAKAKLNNNQQDFMKYIIIAVFIILLLISAFFIFK
jgi:hypothetical protein